MDQGPETSNVPQSESDPTQTYRTLEAEPSWIRYDGDVDRLCRIAASVGGSRPAPLSYTALLIAFLWGEDSVSKWFQEYVRRRSVAVDEIFATKFGDAKITLELRQSYLSRADSGWLPDVEPLFSISAKYVLKQAANVAREVAGSGGFDGVLGARHVMAAFVFRNPSDHKDQVHGWRVREQDWQDAFFRFVVEAFSSERWSLLRQAPALFPEAISSFTSDDPLAADRDLFDVGDEAAAFARIAAAHSVKPPLAIGIFGEWGSGKTYFMRRIYENVEELTARAEKSEASAKLFHKNIVQIRFNAWHYIETNLWASLVEYIFGELDRWLIEKAPDGKAPADLVFSRLATAQQLKLDALEEVVSRRAKRRSAEERAERARKQYEEAVARSAAVGLGTYTRAFLQTILQKADVKEALQKTSKALGAPELTNDAARLTTVLEQARTEAGRARLLVRSGTARLGRWPWVLSAILALIGAPLAVVALKEWVATVTASEAIRSIHETVLAIGGIAAGLAAWGGTLVQRASGSLRRLDEFDSKLRKEIESQQQSADAAPAVAAEDDLRKRRQELEAAERALAEADARLTAAREDFESTSARSRLNAFIRAKATQGDYAKHLGIIAAIRRDFGQLAALMSAANDTAEQRRERRRLREETKARITRFIDWLETQPQVRLTQAEVLSLVSLLDRDEALALVNGSNEGLRAATLLKSRLEGGAQDLLAMKEEVEKLDPNRIPTFSRVILYIDDLDRCPPDNVVKVLQAVHLLLSFPLFTVVVAVDSRWVSRALHDEYPGLLAETRMFAGGRSGSGQGATSHDYLEKIFQIPYWVRAIDDPGAQAYVARLVKKDVRGPERAEAPLPGVEEKETGEGAVPPPQPPDEKKNGDTADDERREAKSLELKSWESTALERFAPFVGGTPRRLIRFVNVYRLIRTSLPGDLLDRFVASNGESGSYRALVPQLAIVTGAPDACLPYFRALERLSKEEKVSHVLEALERDDDFKQCRDRDVVRKILISVQGDPKGRELTVGQIRTTARVARRFSFIARAV